MRGVLLVFVFLFSSINAFAANELRILVWDQAYLPPQETKKFEDLVRKKFNYEVKIVTKVIRNPEHIFEALRSGEVEMASPTHNLINDHRFALIDNELILPIDLTNVPNYAKVIPAARDLSHFYKNGKHYGVPFIFGPYGLVYNTNKMPNPPESWGVLWEDKYKGQYAISHEHYEANTYIVALSLGYRAIDLTNFDKLNEDPRFIDRLNRLARNAGAMWNTDDANAMVGMPLGVSWGFALPGLKAKGESWRLAVVAEGTTSWMDPYVISHSLKNNPTLRRVAEEWVNYSLGEDYQTNAVVRSCASFPVNLDIKARLTGEEVKTFHVDEPNFFKEKLIPWAVMSRRERNGFKSLWDAALQQAKHVRIVK